MWRYVENLDHPIACAINQERTSLIIFSCSCYKSLYKETSTSWSPTYCYGVGSDYPRSGSDQHLDKAKTRPPLSLHLSSDPSHIHSIFQK